MKRTNKLHFRLFNSKYCLFAAVCASVLPLPSLANDGSFQIAQAATPQASSRYSFFGDVQKGGRSPKLLEIMRRLNNLDEEEQKEVIAGSRQRPQTQTQQTAPQIPDNSIKLDRVAPERKPQNTYRNYRTPDYFINSPSQKNNKHLPQVRFVQQYIDLFFDSSATGNIHLIHSMVDYFNDTEIQDGDGNTPLIYAAMAGNMNAIRTLLSLGANMNAQNKHGVSPLYIATHESNVPMAELLIKYRANPDIQSISGTTPLMLASERNADVIVKLLLEAKANINLRQNQGDTALHIAVQNNAIDSAYLLAQFGALTEMRNFKGYTPLMITAFTRNVQMCKFLLDIGADATKFDAKGRTLKDIAIQRGSPEIARLAESAAIEHTLMVDRMMRLQKQRYQPTLPSPDQKPVIKGKNDKVSKIYYPIGIPVPKIKKLQTAINKILNAPQQTTQTELTITEPLTQAPETPPEDDSNDDGSLFSIPFFGSDEKEETDNKEEQTNAPEPQAPILEQPPLDLLPPPTGEENAPATTDQAPEIAEDSVQSATDSQPAIEDEITVPVTDALEDITPVIPDDDDEIAPPDFGGFTDELSE